MMSSKEEIKFVIVVRKDLDMGCGKIAAQVGHACSSVVYNNIDDAYNWINNGNQRKAVLKVKSEKELIDLMKKAREFNILTTAIRDAGKTQIEPNTLTCCGFGPDTSSRLDRLTGHLKLL
jgi:PTH2 family peptidyl-tRNA hydrolase